MWFLMIFGALLTFHLGKSSSGMDAFKGKYERTSEDKYEDFLEALGVNFFLRKAATVSTPQMEITQDQDTWNIKTSTTLKTMELKFKLNEEFDETTPDGREVRTLVTFEDGKIVTVQKAKKEGEKSTRSTRELNGSELIYTLTIDGVDDLVSVQKFKRID